MVTRAGPRGAANKRRAETGKSPVRKVRRPGAGTPHAHALPAAPAEVDAQLRYRMISEAAYLLAKERGFAPGGELDDWLQAEAQINARLANVEP